MPLLRVTALHKYYGDHHVLKGIEDRKSVV